MFLKAWPMHAHLQAVESCISSMAQAPFKLLSGKVPDCKRICYLFLLISDIGSWPPLPRAFTTKYLTSVSTHLLHLGGASKTSKTFWGTTLCERRQNPNFYVGSSQLSSLSHISWPTPAETHLLLPWPHSISEHPVASMHITNWSGTQFLGILSVLCNKTSFRALINIHLCLSLTKDPQGSWEDPL